MKKLLVTGISSFLGKQLAFFPQTEWKITGLFYQNEVSYPGVDCICCDINNAKSLNRIFHEIEPEAVMHLAALSNPNYCELHPEESFNTNVSATSRLATLCSEFKIPLVFTSTDLVFDGENAPYAETDFLQPLMVYGKHKAEAEDRIVKIYEQAIIARLPVIFGNGGFMKNWIDTLKGGGTIAAFTDEYRSMTSAQSAIEGLFLLLNRNAFGIWHLGGKERISRYNFALKMASAFYLPTDKIIASRRSEVTMAAARPADVSMDSRKAYQLGFNPPAVDEALKAIIFD